MKILFLGGGKWGTFALKAAVEAGHQVIVAERVKKSPLWRINYVVRILLHRINLFHPIYLTLRENILYETAWQNYLRVILTASANSRDFIEKIKEEGADLILVASWDEVLKKELLLLPKYGCINCHPALLPKYRGPNPFPWVIINKETESGITFHFINEKIDSGDIILQRKVSLEPEETSQTLLKKTAPLVYAATKEVLGLIGNRQFSKRAQEQSVSSYYPNPDIDSGRIDWKMTTAHILRQLRAFKGWVTLFVCINGKKIFVEDIQMFSGENKNISPGEIVNQLNSREIVISTGDGLVRAKFIRPLPRIKAKTILS